MGRQRRQENEAQAEAQARKEQEAQTEVQGSEQADAPAGVAPTPGADNENQGSSGVQETTEQMIYVKINPRLDLTVTSVRVAGNSYDGSGDNREVRNPVPVSQFEETTQDVYKIDGYQPLVKSRDA